MERKLTSGADCARALLGQRRICRDLCRGTAPRRLRRARREIAAVCAQIGDPGDRRLPRALEWLADNRWLLRRELASAREGLLALPRRPGRTSYAAALCDAAAERELAAGGTPSAERIAAFLRETQGEAPLTDAELGVLPLLLRVSALTAVGEMCKELAAPLGNAEARARDRRLAPRMAACFGLLRMLSAPEFTAALEELNELERLYREDPAGVYSRMSEDTRGAYRVRTALLARRAGLSEPETAARALALAADGEDPRTRHVGYWLFEKPLGREVRHPLRRLDPALRAILPAAFAALTGWAARSVVSGLLVWLPLWALTGALLEQWERRTVPVRHLPRMSPDGPQTSDALCVITALLTGPGDAAGYAARLEAFRLSAGNTGGRMRFGLLADLPESETEAAPGDEAILDAARREIEALNRRWGGGFVLFLRPRVRAAADGCWMGRERKRGAIEDLVHLLRGGETALYAAAGTPGPADFLITLDSDTEPEPGALRALTAAMEHPLNRPLTDPVRRVVTAGHGILYPRLGTTLEAAGRTPFAALYAGPGGADPYGGPAPEPDYDLWGTGSFTGKGILDTAAYAAVLEGRLPENAVLSHDMLEGCYLRAGYDGGAAFLDGFPGSVRSYFRREHRWIRGDWQLIPWLFPRVRTGTGREHNPLDRRARRRIADNLRRSLLAPAETAALLWCARRPGEWIPAAVTAAVLLLPCLLGPAPTGRERRFSRARAGLGGAAARGLCEFALLPRRARVGLGGALTALRRRFITHRGLLDWVTSAQGECGPAGLSVRLGEIWPCAVCAALLLCPASGGVWSLALRIAGAFLWLAAPFAAERLSRPVREETPSLPEADRAWLREQTDRMLDCFRAHMTAENNWLPPDNVQLRPAAGEARRTSPTNIGLGMLAWLAAADLELEPRESVLVRLSGCTASLERMEKWHGQLFNWYETDTLRPMRPRRVSAVDAGNLIACLIALARGLDEWEEPEAAALAVRVRRLCAAMDLTPLYDEKRRLFRLGWDVERDRPAEGHYDLLASEARLTSYTAIARGEVPAGHWASLGRPLRELDGYRGLASWSGTMFEYLMPPLLLPAPRGSLLWESERFAVFCQRRRMPPSLPWGISESGFFSFDGDMNYQYKAHGVQTLGFKRGLDRETVLAPYAAYLALRVDPAGAMASLRRFAERDMAGPYGLYEALDLTPSRTPAGMNGIPIRSYMAHHVGMSILASANVLCGDRMPARFLSDPRMNAFRALLAERIPMGAAPERTRFPREPLPERAPSRREELLWEGRDPDPWRPRCVMLSNGSCRVLVTDTGLNRTLCGMRDLTRFTEKPVGGEPGLLFFLTDGEALWSLAPAPFFDGEASYAARFDTGSARLSMERPGVSTSVTVLVCADDTAGIRRVRVRNTGTALLRTALVCYAEPSLAVRQDFEAHPAFAKLFLQAAVHADGVSVRRQGPDGETHCLALTCGAPIGHICVSRELALEREGYDGLRREPSGVGGNGAPDPCIALRVPVELEPGAERSVTFALGYGRREEDALTAARRALGLDAGTAARRIGPLCQALELSAAGAWDAFRLYRDALFPTPDRRRLGPWRERNTLGREVLWKYGVSGDLPVIAALVSDAPGEREERLLARHMLLYCCGAYADLLLFLRDGGDYRRPAHTALLELLDRWGGTDLIGTRGGVHPIGEERLEPGEYDALLAFSGTLLDLRSAETAAAVPSPPLRIPPCSREPLSVSPTPETEYEAEGVRFRGLPAAAWSHPLAGPDFGWLATDAGTGHMWFRNARENQLTPWRNDPLAITGPETLEVLVNDRAYSLFARDDGSRTSYTPGAAVWERTLPGLSTRLAAFVPPDRNARVFLIELRGENAPAARLRWFASLCLSDREDGQTVTVFSPEKRALYAVNRTNTRFSPCLFAFSAVPAPARFTCDEADYRSGAMRCRTGGGLLPCMAAEVIPERAGEVWRAVIVCGCADREEELDRLTELTAWDRASEALNRTTAHWKDLTGSVRVRTPEPRLDRYLNGFAAYQVVAGRLFARTSLYQCSGAYGFRDQLQDVMSLLSLPPDPVRYRLVRTQILRAAAHQFPEGDVQHWWHPDRSRERHAAERGVRTRVTDDLLFLPWAVLTYCRTTGDRAFPERGVRYLREPPLSPEERERFGAPSREPALRESLWRHCARAADCFVRRGTGSHGLALMGGGDWNDAMNRVGVAGRGESVWLSWFGCMVLEEMADEARLREEEEAAARWTRFADGLRTAAYAAFRDGWFLRGWCDDGTPLGAASCAACRIDGISQAFAPLADPSPRGAARREMQRQALENALRLLWDGGPAARLFTPPFTRSDPQDPGYVKAYPPGLRENGGQYTHGAVWLALGLFRAGMGEEGAALLLSLLPGERGPAYRTEPYYLAADVYAAPELLGRGGWSIYTGAAGWFLRTALEELLGLRFVRDRLYLSPRIPRSWPGFTARIRAGGVISLTVRRGGTPGLYEDGRPAAFVNLPAPGRETEAELVLPEEEE